MDQEKKAVPRSTFKQLQEAFGKLANNAAKASGSAWAFTIALGVILLWAVTGPIFGFSDTWQLIINTGTTIITFLMVFLLQHAQNKDTRAVQMKLDELIAASPGASNRLIDVENLTDRELDHLQYLFTRLAREAQRLGPGSVTTVEKEGKLRSQREKKVSMHHRRRNGRPPNMHSASDSGNSRQGTKSQSDSSSERNGDHTT